MAICKIQDTCTTQIKYANVGAAPACELVCPNCQRTLVKRMSEPFTHVWNVDAAGVQIYCRCGFEWVVDAVHVRLRRVK